MIILTHDPHKRKKVKAGELHGDVFIKEVSQRHFMRIFGGYGIQSDVLDSLDKTGCKFVRIEVSTGEVYISELASWRGSHAIKGRDYGGGPQYFLPVKWMTVKDDKQRGLFG